MKLTILKLMSLFILALTVHSRGGERVGNGGGGLFCKDQRQNILLDYYEGMNSGYTYHLINSMNDAQRIELFDYRIRYHIPELADILKKMRKFFHKRKQYLANADFKIPDDFGDVSIPRDCELKVTMVQRPSLVNGENIFFINRSLYQKLPKVSQNGMINHELLYFISLANSDLNSQKTRKALAYLMSDQYDFNSNTFNEKFLKLIDPSLDGYIEDRDTDGLSDYADSIFPLETFWLWLCSDLESRGFSCPRHVY